MSPFLAVSGLDGCDCESEDRFDGKTFDGTGFLRGDDLGVLPPGELMIVEGVCGDDC